MSCTPIAPTTVIGARLRAARIIAGLSQRELAFAAGCSLQTVSHVETGQRDGRFGTVVGLCDALGVDLDDLVAGLPDVRNDVMRRAWSNLQIGSREQAA